MYVGYKQDHPSKCEVLIDDQWQLYDGHGRDTEISREWYANTCVSFAQGAYSTRVNGVVQSGLSSPDSIFYKRKTYGS